jgi:3',5'-cyclic AMP phosphodiesterase CpdA
MKRVYVLAGLILAVIIIVFLSQYAGDFRELATLKPRESSEGFTIIVLPDTQKYSWNHPHIFTNQTEWIAGQIDEKNIVFVIHEGDIVEHPHSVVEWQEANASMSVLDNRVAYSVLPGNHDKPTELYNEYFPAARYRRYSWYGGNFSGNDNNYQLFTAAGEDYLILNLEFCPKDDAISWANKILQENQDRKTIVATHGYLNGGGHRNVHSCGNTQYIWDSLIAPNNNVFMVLCGHVHSEAMRTDEVGDRKIHQLLADYQDRANGGDGWLRILEFNRSTGRIHVRTYSPYLNQYETDEDSQLTLEFT